MKHGQLFEKLLQEREITKKRGEELFLPYISRATYYNAFNRGLLTKKQYHAIEEVLGVDRSYFFNQETSVLQEDIVPYQSRSMLENKVRYLQQRILDLEARVAEQAKMIAFLMDKS